MASCGGIRIEINDQPLYLTGMNIRPAKESDARTLQELLKQLDYPASLEECTLRIQQHQEDGYHLAMGEIEEQPVGFVAMHWYHAIHHSKPIGRIVGLCVDEPFRAKGLGTSLLNYAEDYFRKVGCFKVELTSNLKRTASHQYYQHRNYRQVSMHFVKML